MEGFSFEDDDYGDMFITQSDGKSYGNVSQGAESLVLGAVYSDISDDDLDFLPSSPVFHTSSGGADM